MSLHVEGNICELTVGLEPFDDALRTVQRQLIIDRIAADAVDISRNNDRTRLPPFTDSLGNWLQ